MGKNKGLKSPRIVSPRTGIEVAYQLLRRRDHVCHLHFGGTLHIRLILLALTAGLLFHKKCAVTIHSGGLPEWGQPGKLGRRLLLKYSFRSCSAIICVNERIAGYFSELGIQKDRIRVVSPFAFSPNVNSNPLPERIAAFLRRKNPLVCSIAGLEPEYDLELLIRGFGRVVDEQPNAGLVIIGSGSLERSLEKLIHGLLLEDKVMLTGDLEHSLTLGVLKESQCFVRVSRYDGDCISLREAICLGIPSIATDTGLRPKEAILVRIGDEDDLVNKMERVFSQPVERRNATPVKELSAMDDVEEILADMWSQR
jgi:glycosyltransferase involved in cell wall biosynthesis